MTVAAAMLLALLVVAPEAEHPHSLTDRAIADYATRPWDKRAMMNSHVTLGTHNGARVVVDFPCSDLCPNYTTRIIHYDLSPGPACSRAGGVERVAIVPVSIAANARTFCVPAVLGTQRIELGGG